jgi:hypothetical protein
VASVIAAWSATCSTLISSTVKVGAKLQFHATQIDTKTSVGLTQFLRRPPARDGYPASGLRKRVGEQASSGVTNAERGDLVP